ncbi:MAG: cation diffusion facilitator family transporter [Desulfobulbaceae bacterium]|uniref:Cation diffusion facilitator family transporter n=1 Tax=Candidatus Desulfatifera sulfidica TaxID=2841691 RepID=A0A8J6TE28_9BACT|nr:cation diffusion facilitator family transporter [Candidatus Desulfatifera sulfidica]
MSVEVPGRYTLKTAERRAVISICLNIVLALGKGVAGVVSGSTALIGDAIHSLTDVLGSSVVFVGIWVAGREHPSFPYGLYKAETLATLVTSMAVMLAGYEIGRQALFGVSRLPNISVALPVTIVSFLVALSFGLLQQKAAKRLGSPGLAADARDYLTDSLSTFVVLLSLLAAGFGYQVDRLAAGIVSLFVFYAGGQLLVGALKDLLDASIDRETEREIIHLVEDHPRITRVKQCFSRVAGGRFLVDMDVTMQTPSHKVADQVADWLEEEIQRQFPKVVLARIRPHYALGEFVRRLTPVTGIDGEPTTHLASAPWFLLETIREADGVVESRKLVENKYAQSEKRRGLLVGRWLLSLKPDEVVAYDTGGAAALLLKEAGVDLVQPSSLTLTTM